MLKAEALEELVNLANMPPHDRESAAISAALKRIYIIPDKLPIVHQIVSAP